MEDTIRELIVKELLARAAVIRSGGSPELYATDCGMEVLRCCIDIGSNELPCANVIPQDEEAENANGKCRHRMPVAVEGVAIFGDDDPSIISERILGDLVRCFTSPAWERARPAGSPLLPPYIESIVYQAGGARLPRESGTVTGAMARFQVTYWTAIGDPCSP